MYCNTCKDFIEIDLPSPPSAEQKDANNSRVADHLSKEINADPYAHNATPFSREEAFPEVIISYATKSRGGKGEEDMWAIANVLRQHGITSFNGLQVEAGENWQVGWYGRKTQAKLAIIMLSPEYFGSSACAEECKAIVTSKIKVIPIQYGMPNTKGNFLGDQEDEIMVAGLIKVKMGNCFPRPDQGGFNDDFPTHAKRLIELVSKKLEDIV